MTCSHHYIYPAPDGRYALGICKHCGARQLGKNSLDVDYNGPRLITIQKSPRDTVYMVQPSRRRRQ